MSRIRSFADKDTTIFEKSTTANVGLAPILQVQNIFNGLTERKEFSRILMRFSLSSLTSGIVNTREYPDPRTDSSVSAYLYVFNCLHGDEQAKSFDLEILPLTQDWDEGTGLDLDKLTETGYANAVSAKSTIAWTTSGGTYTIDSNSATQSFDHGEEDLKVNITNLFNEWLNGYTANYGVIIKMTDLQESKTGSLSAQSLYYKKFYGRETNTTKKPYLQLEWNGSIKDDRNFVPFNSTANLFFYNIRNGQLLDLSSTSDFPGNISVSGLSGVSWSGIHNSLTAVRHSKGIYKCNFTMPLSGNNYSQFRDRWYLSASPTSNYTFTFTCVNPDSGFDNYVTSKYRVSLKNLKNEYEKRSVTRIRINIKDDSLVLTPLTAATTAVNNFIVTEGTYEIRELDSDLVEQSAVDLSYDKNGNFFSLDTNNLYLGVNYKIVLKLNIRGETFYYDYPDIWRFKVI